MPISSAERQRAHRQRLAEKIAVIDSLYATVTAAAGRGHQLAAAVLDDDIAATISHLAECIGKEAAAPTTPAVSKPVTVAIIRTLSENQYECALAREQAGIYSLAEYLAQVQRQGMLADIPAQFWGRCPIMHGQPGTALRLTATTGMVTYVVVWEQRG